MTGKTKRKSIAALMALVICIALMATGCSGTEKAAMAGDAETNAIEENAEENTDITETIFSSPARAFQI